MPPKKKSVAEYNAEFADRGLEVSAIDGYSETSHLCLELFTNHQWDDQTILISRGQLEAGLPLPLYDIFFPLFYDILSHPNFSRAICQLSGDGIRLIIEFCTRALSGKSQYSKAPRKAGVAAEIINRDKYTVENFYKNYSFRPVQKEDKRWAVTLHRNADCPKEDRLMQDIDYASGTNQTPRHSKDESWYKFPLRLKGSYISGIVPLPDFLVDRNYQPWVLNWPTRIQDVCNPSELYFPFTFLNASLHLFLMSFATYVSWRILSILTSQAGSQVLVQLISCLQTR